MITTVAGVAPPALQLSLTHRLLGSGVRGAAGSAGALC